MHTYQMPLVGLTINTDFGGHFNQALQYIIDEYDLTSPAELTMAIFVEYVEEFESGNISKFSEDFEEVSEDLENEKDLLIMFFNWIEKYHSDFTLIKAYHGSAPETPIALVYNGFTYDPSDDSTSHYEYEDCSSYSVSLDSLEKIIKDVKDFNLFSIRTMPEELFSYLDERGYFSLQYLNCSS